MGTNRPALERSFVVRLHWRPGICWRFPFLTSTRHRIEQQARGLAQRLIAMGHELDWLEQHHVKNRWYDNRQRPRKK